MTFHAALSAEREATQAMDEGEELETEEIFNSILPRGATTVTIKEVKKWDYIKDLLEDGDLDAKSLRDIVQEASGKGNSGKLTLEKFDFFINLLVDHLGLEEAGSVEDTVEYYRNLGSAQLNDNGDEKEAAHDGMVFEVLDPEAADEGDIEGLDDISDENQAEYVLVEDENEPALAHEEVYLGDKDEFVFTGRVNPL